MMETPVFTCLIADSRCADLYRADGLDAGDRQRLHRNPALEERTDWRVSRHLKQQSEQPVKSLSHSGGAAAVLCGRTTLPAGIDIEQIRPRGFPALAAWTATEAERRLLAANGWQAADFYRLWTLKEALLKAANLDFPADMAAVGWQNTSDGLCLHVGGQRGWHGVSTVFNGRWALACVWQGRARAVFRTPDGWAQTDTVYW